MNNLMKNDDQIMIDNYSPLNSNQLSQSEYNSQFFCNDYNQNNFNANNDMVIINYDQVTNYCTNNLMDQPYQLDNYQMQNDQQDLNCNQPLNTDSMIDRTIENFNPDDYSHLFNFMY